MRRRTFLKRAGASTATVAATGLAGCSSDSEGDDTSPTALPELQISGEQLENSVDGLSIADHEHGLRMGQAHQDVHFGVTATIENTGDQQTNLGDYTYDLTLFDADDIDMTPGDTWTTGGDELSPGETGTILVQVSFLNAEGATPKDVARYDFSVSCDGSGSYC